MKQLIFNQQQGSYFYSTGSIHSNLALMFSPDRLHDLPHAIHYQEY
jgi:hypothetical protein